MGNKVALVTGAGRGIGLGIALGLARKGFSVALNALEPGEELDAAVQKVAQISNAVGTIFDVGDSSVYSARLDEIEAELGPITTLVNNAGVSVMNRGDLLNVTEESFDRCLDVNTKAMFFLSQAVAMRFVARGRTEEVRAIVNITSVNADVVSPSRGEYCVSKAAAAMVSKIFATRLGELGVPVFEVRPGLIETEMTAGVIKDYRKSAENGLCIYPRVGQPEDVGDVVATLASGELPYVTGQTIAVDGGLTVQRF